MKTLRPFALLLLAAALSACEQNALQEDEITGPVTGSAQVKFFHFGLNGPGVNFYANDTKMTAITSGTGVESTTGTAFGAVGSGGLYAAVAPGQYTLSGRIAAATDKNLAIANVPATLAEGKRYSFYLSGLYNATAKTQDAFVVEDNLPARDVAVACLRFVSGIFNSQPMTMYARNLAGAETAIGSAVAYKAGGAFVCVPEGIYDVHTRTAGSSTNAISRTGVSLIAGRVYTIAGRGDMTVPGTTATNRPFLDNTANW